MIQTLGFCIKVAVCSSPSSFTVPIIVGTLLNWPVTISLSGSCAKNGFLTYIKSDTGAQTTGKAIIPVAKAVKVINGILLPKLFWPTVKTNCSGDREKLLKFEAECWEFVKILRSLEQFIQTVKGQNNSW